MLRATRQFSQCCKCAQQRRWRHASNMFDSNNLDELEHEEDHFKLFGMQDKQFTLDMQQLEKKFKELQRLYHPDKNSEQIKAEKLSAKITRAYDTLKRPQLRAHYLLDLQGEAVSASDVDQDFLLQMMDKMENVSDLSLQDTLQARKSNAVLLSKVEQELGAKFAKKQFVEARQYAAKLNYFARYQEALEERLESEFQHKE